MGNTGQYKMIKEVNRITGFGLMFCYEALKRADWDVQKAVEYLRRNPPVHLS